MSGFIDAIREAPPPSIAIVVICLFLLPPLTPLRQTTHFIHLRIQGPGVPQFGGVAEQRWLRLEETLTIASWPFCLPCYPQASRLSLPQEEDEVLSLG